MSTVPMILSRRLRPSPYEKRVLENGASAFSLYNKMILPMVYDSYEAEYEHLCGHVQIWDVACQRQVEIVGPDALRLVELITPRDISRCDIGQCMYAPLCDENGGIVNDPVILRLAPDRFWLSIADSDVCLWAKGIAYGRGFDVRVFEPDVSPLAIQGPKADDLVADVVGRHSRDIRFFRFIDETIAGTPVKLARSGWSGQGGFEVYLQDSSKGLDLWDTFWEAGLEKYINLDKPAEYMSREALARIAKNGPEKRLVHLAIDGKPLGPMRAVWTVLDTRGGQIGLVTTKVWSPRFSTNIAFAIVQSTHAAVGTRLTVDAGGEEREAVIRDEKWQSG